jgi:hypothetical protein
MRLLAAGRLGWIVAVVEAVLLLHLWLAREAVVISKPSNDRKLIAQVVATRDFPYLSVQAYLVIRDTERGNVRQEAFLIARDVLQDVVMEVHSVSWSGTTVTLDIESPNYSGPRNFTYDE